jgi:enoyl-CoA hydratase
VKFNNILFKVDESIGVLTINRPKVLNALNTATFKELDQVLDQIEAGKNIRGILVQGAGDKAFVAGADISEIQQLNKEKGEEFSRFGQLVFNRFENLNIPVIALINGFALGGGLEFAMACHIRIAASNAKFGQPEVNLGLLPGYGATQRLPRIVGRGAALELLLSAEMISADRAFELGLINQIVETDALFETGKNLLLKIVSKGPLALEYVLKSVRYGLEHSLDQGLASEAKYFGMACASADMKEGTSAFLEKRRPNFKGK